MKQKKLYPLLAYAISLEMMLAPLPVIAQDDKAKEQKDNPVTPAKKKSSVSSDQIMGALSNLTNAGAQAYNQYMAGKNPQARMDLAVLQKQQTAIPDELFNPQKLSQIPGLNAYLALNKINPQSLYCQTLPSTLSEIKSESCRLGVVGDTGVDPSGQLSQMLGYSAQYDSINKLYKNYSTISNTGGQQYGVGCMKHAMQVLNGFFKYRLDEMDKLKTNLEAINNQFKEASKMDLNAIEESTAVLDGEGSPLTDKVKTRRPDLFDFGKRFDNDACKSMFSTNDLNKAGKQQGLLGIQTNLKDVYTTQSGDPAYSGESFAKSYNDVVNDINNLADKVSKQVELNYDKMDQDYGGFVKDLGGSVTSTNNFNKRLNGEFFSDLQAKFQTTHKSLDSQTSDLRSEFAARGIKSDSAINLFSNLNTGSFESEVTSLEYALKNQCLASNLGSSGSIDNVLGKIYDPKASSFANKNSPNFLKNKIKQIMTNPSTSPDKKLAELEEIEKQGNGRFLLRRENSYEVQSVDTNGNLTRTVVPAGMAKTPSMYFADLINNCEAQFKVNKLGNKLTGEEAIAKLRKLNQDYKALAKQQSQDIKEVVKQKLLECPSADIANSSKVGSCSAKSFDTQSPSFCAKAALSCSNNMKQCNAQADKFVEDIKTDRAMRVNNYKALMEKNKQDIVKIFDTTLSQFMKEGEALRAAFGVGFSSPDKIQRDVPDGEKYLPDFQGVDKDKLLLEDPQKFVEMFARNIDNLKAKVAEQQQQIIGSGADDESSILGKHIAQTKQNYQTVMSDSARIASECKQQYDGYVKSQEQQRGQQNQEFAKKTGELNDSKAKFCRQYGLVANSPNPSCDGKVSDLADSVLSAVNTSEANEAAANLVTACSSYNNQYNDNSEDLTAEFLCDKYPEHLLCKDKRKYDACLISFDKDNCGYKDKGDLQDRIDKQDEKIVKTLKSRVRDSEVTNDKIAALKKIKDHPTPSFCNAQNNSSGNTKMNLPFGLGEGRNPQNPLAIGQ